MFNDAFVHARFSRVFRWLGAALALCFVLASGSSARADLASCIDSFIPPPSTLNICERLVDELVVNKVVSHDQKSCDWSTLDCVGGIFAGVPHCCLPDVCLADPICYSIHTVTETVQYVYHAGDIYCDPREISAKDLLTKFSRGLLVDPKTGVPLKLVDNTAGPVLDALQAAIQAMECGGKPLSEDAIATLLELKNGYRGSFDEQDVSGGWTAADLRSIRIIANRDWPASQILPKGKAAVTLERLVIVNEEDFDTLTSGNLPSAADMLEGRVDYHYAKAFDLVTHEAVHIRQYRETGTQNFVLIYLGQLAEQGGYEGAAFEDEAYTFAADVARERGGDYCTNQADFYIQQERSRDISLRIDPCRARPSAMTWLSSHP